MENSVNLIKIYNENFEDILISQVIEWVHENILLVKKGILLDNIRLSLQGRQLLFYKLQEEYYVLTDNNLNAMFVLINEKENPLNKTKKYRKKS